MKTIVKNKETSSFRKIDRKEPEWLYNIRKNSWKSYSELSVPDRVVHLWRYTNPADFTVSEPQELMRIFPPLPDPSESKSDIMHSGYSAYGYNRPDFMTIARLHPDLEGSGIVFKDLLSAVRENDNLVGNHLGHLVGNDFGKFEALNLSLWNTGLFLYIPDNTILEQPIRLQRHPSGPYTLHRLLIVIGKNSQATIIDDYSGQCRKEDALINGVAEVFVGESSQAKYVNIQRHADNCKTYVTQRAQLARDSQIYSVFAGLGSSLSKINAGSILNGVGASSQIFGLAFGHDTQQFDYHTLHHHKAGQSYSNIDFKVALKDRANSAYTGLIKIEEDALNCEAFQENRNLLLNKGPKAESIPELEILCDQVQCSHGATVGPIDPETLFYLESRGLDRAEATRTIVSGFVEPTLKQLPDGIQELTRELVLDRLRDQK